MKGKIGPSPSGYQSLYVLIKLFDNTIFFRIFTEMELPTNAGILKTFFLACFIALRKTCSPVNKKALKPVF
jgi:hypothetical protein